jgi:hypothetical protein
MTEKEPDQKYIVCLSVQMALWNSKAVAEGSVEKQCGRCGIPVWLSQSGQKMLKEDPSAQLRCQGCLRKMVAESKEPVKFGSVPGAIEEALENIKKQEEKDKA